MNSLNLISARVSPSSSPVPSRSNSLSSIGLAVAPTVEAQTKHEEAEEEKDTVTAREKKEDDARTFPDAEKLTAEPEDNRLPEPSPPYPAAHLQPHQEENTASATASADATPPDESSPLLPFSGSHPKEMGVRSSGWHRLPRRFASSLINSLRWILTTFVATPGYYLIAWLYDEEGSFAPFFQVRRLFGGQTSGGRKLAMEYDSDTGPDGLSEKYGHDSQGSRVPLLSSGSTSSGLTSESDSEMDVKALDQNGGQHGGGSRHARSKSLAPPDESAPARRSIRIKLHSEDPSRTRKHRKAQSASAASMTSGSAGGLRPSDISAQLKSPTSPAGAMTKYPKTPAPPRPLIPRRQPSYLNLLEAADRSHQKTLILDLDETLIHSLSKGGRMGGSGHMVEVRLNTAFVGMGTGQATIGPQHPILYYVHKRPHCDHFLRRVCKWYNLVVFTASVQEYADPVIDWLESERKFFSARFYRQHCTFRHGAFIKDLSSVEPDLSKVVILDNSPLSYLFHQDNAIPIQGWINDPTDNDLLHLVPLLEGLQYVSDVRALLALRGGEDGKHMA